MEREYFQPSHPESSDDSTEDSSESSKSKKTKRAQELAKLLSRQTEQKESDAKKEPDDRSLWQRLVGDPSSPTQKEANKETSEESTETEEFAEPEAPLEELSEEEQLLVMQAYVEARLQELAEPETSAPAAESEDEPSRLATQTLLLSLRQRFTKHEPGKKVEEDIQEAYDESVGELTDNPDAHQTAETTPEATPRQGQEPALHELRPDEPLHVANLSSQTLPQPVEQVSSVQPEQMVDADEAHYRERTAQQRGLLVGGVVGYMIGRRRGRIKTEKRLNTVHKKLESQVVDLQQKIVAKEEAIARVARDHHTIRPPEMTPRQTPTKANQQERQPARAAAALSSAAAEASPRHGASLANREPGAEQRPPARTPEQTSPQPVSKEVTPVLTREELMQVSEKIKFGETNLRRVYDAKLVDESGLRRLIQEYYAGHDLRRSLAREVMVKEMRFERDPRMRPKEPEQDTQKSGVSSTYQQQPSTNDIASSKADDSQTKSPAKTSPQRSSASSQSSQRNPSAALIAFLTIVTVALAFYAIWLTVTR